MIDAKAEKPTSTKTAKKDEGGGWVVQVRQSNNLGVASEDVNSFVNLC